VAAEEIVMGYQSLSPWKQEEIRIQAAYARRQDNDLYSLFNAGALFMVQEEKRVLLALLKRYGVYSLSSKKILEVGCGTGYWLREFIQWGAHPAHITGIDLLPDHVERAREFPFYGCYL
jgi:SAM-dependent methyltransferase